MMGGLTSGWEHSGAFVAKRYPDYQMSILKSITVIHHSTRKVSISIFTAVIELAKHRPGPPLDPQQLLVK